MSVPLEALTSVPRELTAAPLFPIKPTPECPARHSRPHSSPTFYKKLQISLLRTDLLPWPQHGYLIKALKEPGTSSPVLLQQWGFRACTWPGFVEH